MTTPLAGHPTFAVIDAAALRANFAAVRAVLPADVAVVAVVKTNAYGHCAALVAPIFEAAGADYLGVATIEEGVEMRVFGQINESQNAYSSGAAFNGTGIHATSGPKRGRKWKTEK
jgi:alanine racemase